MLCCAVKPNQLKPMRGNSGANLYCATALIGFFIGDNIMKRIQLTQNQVALVDDEDYKELNQHKWYAAKNNYGGFFAVRGKGKSPHQRTVSMHREIMNFPKRMQVDHRNHHTLDNRKSNLRICNCSENMQNGKAHKGGTSKHKGVVWHKNKKKWMAQIQLNGKQTYLGYFINEIEAANAYNEAATELFGEFAYLNQV